MKPILLAALAIIAIVAAFWAYTIMDSLLHEYVENVTFVDLAVIYALGLISGLALGLAVVLARRRTPTGK